ncbi:MAG TPA: glycosyltransferase family 1 protein [Mucilaginibacter sp.]
MRKLHLYFRIPPPSDRFISGDRYVLPAIRQLVKGKKIGGIQKVFINLCKGLDELKVDYDVNLPFKKIQPGEPVVVLGSGRYALKDYSAPNKIIAGIALMTHPSEWPDLFEKYPVATYLQHSEWTRDLYANHYGGDKCGIWPAGIDTKKWSPDSAASKQFDILIYNKIMWNKQETYDKLARPIIAKLEQLGLSYTEIVYGNYKEAEYFDLLNQSKAMVFLCEHESQGFACCEAMSMNVPVFAWDQGWYLDPHLETDWNEPKPLPASSVPFFDETCGMKFTDPNDFNEKIEGFWENVKAGTYHPRDYILQNLTLEKSAQAMLDLVGTVYP